MSSSPSMSPVDIKSLVSEFEVAMKDPAGWCSLEKATILASIVLSLRPKIVVELGVWMGGSALPMAIALRRLGAGQLLAVDAWSTEASIAGQDEPAHATWWGTTMGDVGHQHAFETFLQRLRTHGIPPDRCVVRRQRTDVAEVPAVIDVLHHDANHGPQAVDDVDRWASAVRVGGMLVIDDLDWVGGHVVRARDRAIELGFVELYPLGTGCVMQRVRA